MLGRKNDQAYVEWTDLGPEIVDSAGTPVISAGQLSTLRAVADDRPIKKDTMQSQYAIADDVRYAADRIGSLEEAAHFLRQCTMGPTWQEIQDCFALGSRKLWLRQQLAKSLDKSFIQRLVDEAGVPTNDWSTSFATRLQSQQAWTTAFILDSAQLRVKLVHALSNIFIVSVPGGGMNDSFGWLTVGWFDRLNNGAFGNYRTILEDVTYSMRMARMLTYYKNRRAAPDGSTQPDENYAREIMQLFTIGLWEMNLDGTYKLDDRGNRIPTYNNEDIRQLARVFTGLVRPNSAAVNYNTQSPANDTAFSDEWFFGGGPGISGGENGWTYDNPLFRLKHYVGFYESGAKLCLGGRIDIPAGTPGPQNITMALDGLFSHPNVAPFVSIRLIQAFVTSSPSPAYIARVASVFNDNGNGVKGDMKAVMMAILTDPEAAMRGAIFEKHGRILTGFEAAIADARSLERRLSTGRCGMSDADLIGLGGRPFYQPSIFGFYDPLYSPFANGRLLPEAQMYNTVQVINTLNTMRNRVVNGELRDTPNSTNLMTSNYSMVDLAGTSADLIQRLNLLLAGGQLSAQAKADFITVAAVFNLATDTGRQDRMSVALNFIEQSPEFRVQL
jgi:uncharacterized protein (DUF1800 family)